MKLLRSRIATAFLALPFLNLVSYAGESDIHQEVVEKKDIGGNVVGRVEETYRGKSLIMETDSSRSSNGTMTVDFRAFYVGGALVMTENKSNPTNTGSDTLALFRMNTNDLLHTDVEIFTREADGSVKPVSTPKLKDYKKEVIASTLAFQVIGGSATNLIKDTIVSPDKKLKALVFERDYGALSSFNRQVLVLENAEPFSEYDADKVLFCVTADGNASKYLSEVNVSWISTNEIRIRYPISSAVSGPRSVLTNSPNQAIKVIYESFEVK